ncbi:hypothetical protein ACR9H8_07565 [Kosakonia cowanii]|jgi:hypothetical protein|uniref:hypothetical protein n=1 Tax=Kosakonia cowanii TaxID=208223 RepID=UPI0021E8E232|nr:hypothetical protein [Kosakonia cowanii]MBS5773783.1 hypothetical protein [Enterobacter cloacae]WKW44356.1 hypothetical protein PZO50_10575 [Kosakonia cowanii]
MPTPETTGKNEKSSGKSENKKSLTVKAKSAETKKRDGDYGKCVARRYIRDTHVIHNCNISIIGE